MSISFQGPHGSFDLTNVSASRLLVAMGYKVTESTDGSMPLADAKLGLERAKTILSGQDLEFLGYLEEIIQDVEQAGGDVLTWW